MRDIWLNTTILGEGNFSISDILEAYSLESKFVYHHPENILLISIYIPLFLMALFSNILVIAVFTKYKSFRTVSHQFLMSLSIADLLVTVICIPAAVGQAVHSAWIFGNFACKVNHYMQGVAVGASVFTLASMSIDRCLAIRYPLKRKQCLSRSLITTVILLIWIVSLGIFAPLLYVRKTDGFRVNNHDFVYCLEDWQDPRNQKIFGMMVFILIYAVPGIIILFAYALMGCRLWETHLFSEMESESRSNSGRRFQVYTMATINLMKERRKVARMLMVLATVFAVCWLPSMVLGLILDYSSSSNKSSFTSDEEFELYVKLHKCFILLGHLNSLLNPLLYTLLTKNFRNYIRDWISSYTDGSSNRRDIPLTLGTSLGKRNQTTIMTPKLKSDVEHSDGVPS